MEFRVKTHVLCVVLSAVPDMLCAIQLWIQEQSHKLVAVEEFAKLGLSWWASHLLADIRVNLVVNVALDTFATPLLVRLYKRRPHSKHLRK